MFGGYDLDLLEIRLNTLADVVNKFLIIEAPITHTLIPKPLVFLENQSRFEQFKDKIIYFTSECRHENPFVNDWGYRHILFDNIPNPKFDDIIHHSDNDEISNPDILKETINNLSEPVTNITSYRFFTTDLYGRKSSDAFIMKYGWFKDQIYKYRDTRNSDMFKKIDNAGWHFSSCGKISDIINKWAAFSHASEIDNKYKNEDYIKSQIRRKCGSWSEDGKNDELTLVEHKYPNIPQYLLDHKDDKFPHLFYDFYKD